MSFDAFCYSTTNAEDIPGETQDETYAEKKAFEILSFELGAENNINIGSISGGGGAGKATFKEVSITKKTDTASTGLFHALVTGKHFDNVFIELRRSGQEDTKSGGKFMVFEMQMVMVQDISWSGSDGDDVCEETLILQYGAIKIHYYPQDTKGKMAGQPKEAYWNRVKNNKSMIY